MPLQRSNGEGRYCPIGPPLARSRKLRQTPDACAPQPANLPTCLPLYYAKPVTTAVVYIFYSSVSTPAGQYLISSTC